MADGLLNKASIILTPTGYKAGTLYNVAPVVEPYEDFDFARASVASRVNSSGLVEMVGRTLGNELVTDGDFTLTGTQPPSTTGTYWTTANSWTISNNKASYDGTTNGSILEQAITLDDGSTYEVKITISDNSGRFRLSIDSGTADFNTYTSGDGTYTFYVIATADELQIRGSLSDSAATFSVSNISLKKIIDTNNIPRINYDSNGDNGHILLEPTSTNLLPYSEDFEAGSWTNESIGTTPTLDGGYTAPDGSNSAYKISNANQDSFWYYPSVADSDYARTIWARTVSGTGTAQLTSHNSNTNNTFNLTETWQRFEVNSTTSSIGEQSFYAVDFRGSGTLTELLIWGAQVEALSYATSYIPTLTGSTVTRATETATGAGSATLINSTEGVLYAEIAALVNGGVDRIISLSDETNNNLIYIRIDNTANRINSFARGGGGTYNILTVNGVNQTNTNKIALVWDASNVRVWINGSQSLTQSINNTPTGIKTLSFTSPTGGSPFYGKCKALAVFNEALSDSELTQLTT
jgi:hypothetical protein